MYSSPSVTPLPPRDHLLNPQLVVSLADPGFHFQSLPEQLLSLHAGPLLHALVQLFHHEDHLDHYYRHHMDLHFLAL